MLLVSQIGTCLGFLVMARADALWIIFVARVIDGPTAGNLSTAQAYISDNAPPQNRAKSFGLVGIAFGLGFFIGPSVTGFRSSYGLTAPIYPAAGLSITSILVHDVPPSGRRASREPGTHPRARWPAPLGLGLGHLRRYFGRPGSVGGSSSSSASPSPSPRSRRASRCSPSVASGGTSTPSAPPRSATCSRRSASSASSSRGGSSGRLVKRFGEAALVAPAFWSIAIGYGALGMIHGVGLLILASTVSSFGIGVLRPSLTSLISKNAARNEQGIVLGLNRLASRGWRRYRGSDGRGGS